MSLFDDLYEEFLDEIFEYDSKLNRKDFESSVVKKQAYIFNPKKIREKIMTNCAMNVSYTSRRTG